jgi:hypothetical protein
VLPFKFAGSLISLHRQSTFIPDNKDWLPIVSNHIFVNISYPFPIFVFPKTVVMLIIGMFFIVRIGPFYGCLGDVALWFLT